MKNFIIHNKLNNLQFNANKNNGKFLIIKIDPGGYGAELSRRLLGLKLAYIFNRTAIFDYSSSLYLNCYKPLSSFKPSDFSAIKPNKLNFRYDQFDKLVYFDFKGFWRDVKRRQYVRNWLPVELKIQHKTPEYFWGQLFLFLKLLPEYNKFLETSKIKLNFYTPIIGMHIRRGDKKVESPYVPMRIYNYFLKKIVNETGIKRVFVTSDSKKVFSKLPKDLGIEYIYDKEEKRYNNANFQFVKNNPILKKEETLTAIKIIDLLSSCDYIIGQKNTQFTILANASKEAQNYHNHTYFVNRQFGNIYLNNDYNYLFHLIDIFKKYFYLILQKIVQKTAKILKPLIKNKKFFNVIKDYYYGMKN